MLGLEQLKYQDSIKQAQVKSANALRQLAEWNLPSNPINYSVSYEYIAGENKALNVAIKQQLTLRAKLDSFFIDDVYRDHVLGQSSFRDELITDLDDILDNVEQQCTHSKTAALDLIKQINQSMHGIESNDQHEIQLAVLQLRKATITFQVKQKQTNQQLQLVKKESNKLRVELETVKKTMYVDPLTGLFNRKAMLAQMDKWLIEDGNKEITAIAISVEQIKQFSLQYGQLMSDVVLEKVASKIIDYVTSSGLPIRTGTDEILVLLPDLSPLTAGEIAEKIRHGIEKLSFVRKKTGLKLPKISLALAVTSFNAKQGIEQFLIKTERILIQAKTQQKMIIAE